MNTLIDDEPTLIECVGHLLDEMNVLKTRITDLEREIDYLKSSFNRAVIVGFQ